MLGFGYRVDCIRYVPRQLVDSESAFKLDFDHVVCRRMVEVGRPLNFIQIGAFDGETRDPIFTYIRRHCWRGILVEPQRLAWEKLTRLHADSPDIQIVNAAVAQKPGKGTLYTVQGDGLPAWCGGLASFSRESILKHRELIAGLENFIRPEEVALIPFTELLESARILELDVLQIDTEGADAEILPMFPFDRLRPAIIHWEVKHLPKEELEGCLDRLASHGNRFAPSGGEDMLAILCP